MSFIIRGDLLDGKWTHIVQQCNCCTRSSRGLAKSIADKYPYSDIYARRNQNDIPGGVLVAEGPGPVIFNFMAQYEPGKPKTSMDSYEIREKWFESCLLLMESVGISKYQIRILAFPYGIGCGLAGGNWERYKNMIDEFAKRVQLYGVTVYIVDPGY